MSVAWTLRLAAQAELDFSEIVAWTREDFGERQAETYAETLTLAIEALHDGPIQLGTKARDDIEPGIRTYTWRARGGAGVTLWCSERPRIRPSMCCACFTTAWTWPGMFRLLPGSSGAIYDQEDPLRRRRVGDPEGP